MELRAGQSRQETSTSHREGNEVVTMAASSTSSHLAIR